MDKRTLLALLLTAIVIVSTPILFPPARRVAPVATDSLARDSAGVGERTISAPDTLQRRTVGAAPAPRATRTDSASTPALAAVRAETTVVRTARAEYRVSSPGGVPAVVALPAYRSLRPGAPAGTPVRLTEASDPLFSLRLVDAQRDTIALDTVGFRAEAERREGGSIIRELRSTTSAVPITLTYRFSADSFVTNLEGRVGSAEPRTLLVTLPTRIRSDEADPREDARHLAFAYKGVGTEVHNIPFRDLDSLARVDTGAIRWVALRNKYFVVAVIPTAPDTGFRALVTRGGPRADGEAVNANAMALLPLRDGTFSLRVYAGPQAWNQLRATARELENVNPYGGWFHGLVQPFTTIVMRMLLWMRSTFDVGYGWVLVIFGVAVRLLLWPLNQSAMRSGIQMQRLQPELAEIQKKYKDDPEKQRSAIMKVYQDHGMSPFTPMLGCLPMLLPMPILFALYFVFQNTIEFRGVPFLWLPDLSLKDPYYITPLFMGVSMFVLSWIGMRGVPPTPQSKMMAYAMPVMFTVLFLNFASGLNLYYAVQNVAALPQQWLIARERKSSAAAATKGTKEAAKGSKDVVKGTKRDSKARG